MSSRKCVCGNFKSGCRHCTSEHKHYGIPCETPHPGRTRPHSEPEIFYAGKIYSGSVR